MSLLQKGSREVTSTCARRGGGGGGKASLCQRMFCCPTATSLQGVVVELFAAEGAKVVALDLFVKAAFQPQLQDDATRNDRM